MIEDVKKALCPECQKQVNCKVLHQHKVSWAHPDADIQGLDVYEILCCQGCDEVFFCKESSNSEDLVDVQVGFDEWEADYYVSSTYWPSTPKYVNNAFTLDSLARKNFELSEMLKDSIRAANEDMPVLAAIGIRTCFDILSVDMGAAPNDSFADKLETLRKEGFIGGKQKGRLSVLIDAGSAAAHRGWKPRPTAVAMLLDLLNGVIQEHYFLQEEIDQLKSKIPEKGGKVPKFGGQAPKLDLSAEYKNLPGLPSKT
ncbi:MAG: DUF4145 domain-containing protein [Pseudomonadota bacterium]|nr:DUF4145 domain-containing protein [Pseudomonadota bacterium]